MLWIPRGNHKKAASKQHLTPNGGGVPRIEMLIDRGKMPLPLFDLEISGWNITMAQKAVGVASSHDAFVPLSMRGTPCPWTQSLF